ncbi:putative rta1 domain protein [Lasiodiplodia theobromae]|nr:putative rta1 domain protein [Lasiodiplodia theobromae]
MIATPSPTRRPTIEEMKGYRQGCTQLMPNVPTSYDYVPHLSAGIAFCVLFSLSMTGHIVQGVRKRNWTSYVLATGALTELLGWTGRTWSSQCPYNETAFLLQITTLIIAPTFFSAAAYLILGTLIRLSSTSSPSPSSRLSILSPTAYLVLFCAADAIALATQAVGGALASLAQKRGTSTATGTNIMVGGVVFQMGAMTVFVGLLADFLQRMWRLGRNSGGGMMTSGNKLPLPQGAKWILLALLTSVAAIYVRSVYRTVELLQGWRGYLIVREGYFVALDAAMMVVAVGVYNVLDPAVLLLPSCVQEGQGEGVRAVRDGEVLLGGGEDGKGEEKH